MKGTTACFVCVSAFYGKDAPASGSSSIATLAASIQVEIGLSLEYFDDVHLVSSVASKRFCVAVTGLIWSVGRV